MSHTVGSSRRRNILGHSLVADEADLTVLRRQATSLLGRFFQEAQDHGQSHLAIDGVVYVLHRHPDHTFTLTSSTTTRPTPW